MNCFVVFELRIGSIAQKNVEHVAVTCQSGNEPQPRVQLQCAMSQPYRLSQPFEGRYVKL
jgi:hypothetical protein